MALTKTFPTQDAGGLSITDTRRVMTGLVVKNADGTPRAGIFPAHGNPLVTGRASMGYDVAPFFAALSRIAPGVEFVANDAVMTVATDNAPAANSRIDVIWVRSRFVQHADGSNLPEIGVTKGNAAAVPTKPAIPAGAFELATAEVLSTTTTTATVVITQTHAYTAAAGGVVWLRSQAEQDAWAPANGALAFRLDTGTLMQRTGGNWRATVKEIRGRVSRSATPTTFPAAYTNVAANTFWTADTAVGLGAYNNGWVIPETGWYLLSYEIRASGAFLAGLTIDYAGASPTLILATSPQPVQGIAGDTIFAPVKLNAGQVVRPYLLAAAGTPSWVASVGFFAIEWVGGV